MSIRNSTSATGLTPVVDVLVVGGGINGAGIAADAAGRGLSVALYEANDFASATSSASSKLIHGGLRYLEHYEFRLVSEALAEREVILRKAPHIARPMRFRLPHRPFLRPAWMIRCGLFLYDHLGKRTTLPGSKTINLAESGLLKPEIKTGFEYSDCWVDDARLVLLNALAAKKNNAEVRNYCKVEKAYREGGIWHVTIHNEMTGQHFERKAKVLVNAAGPWVKRFFDEGLAQTSPRNIRLIKGSHIVVPRVHNEPEAYILQNQDNRIVFLIPYLDKFTIIGTTDVEYSGDPKDVTVSDDEINYLLDVANQHFIHQLTQADIVWSYSGVRPLCDDESSSPQAVTRDYTLELDTQNGLAPLLSVFGGKLTTYRKLSEAAMKKLAPFLPRMGGNWTANQVLPGGNFSCTREQLATQFQNRYRWAPQPLILRYMSQFGTQAWDLMEGISDITGLGHRFSQQAGGVYQCEIDYLVNHEMALTVEDILWRRTKLGLYINEDEKRSIAEYLKQKLQNKVVSLHQVS